ncbi:signal peptidase II [Blochmannia endosymbiont of Camponotus (Colobopsis) obliquus]|uniref:signal peptidase II n=1 Tax=Blochmannia endosymbiont of Camponotus (Colobopsis) obliquus TaxID=1505597 RepID=UPI00061A8778|nr:signal peptidase II [Blochmannia endosymbiont of Camponotus (Colobopsis) obliquus]AKC60296.1 Lipoprotein signal peptidase [Blochmannia endosymbiont of Camponotus (Colobopsis) obliquus]
MKILKYTGLRWLWLSLLIVIVDLFSKEWVAQHFYFGEMQSLIPCVNCLYTYNFGIIFGILNHSTIQYRWCFVLISICIIIVLLRMMYRLDHSVIIVNMSYAMIIGGGLGNLFDRIFRGAVVDFIDFYIDKWHYPTFNIADIAIVCGVFLIICNDFLYYRR